MVGLQSTHQPNGIQASVCIVKRNGVDYEANILQRNEGEIYVHYANTDKRMDEWIPESAVREVVDGQADGRSGSNRKRKRRGSRPGTLSPTLPALAGAFNSIPDPGSNGVEEVPMTEEEYDIEHHKKIYKMRNFDKVNFGEWQIKTWYYSPYPLIGSEADEVVAAQGSSSNIQSLRIPGVSRTTIRSHGRTSDLLAGGLGRTHGLGEKSILWVCDRCFKYMADGSALELHKRKCTRNHPPGRKVYERGAHVIWEVDGAKEKLYCQNLSLFGKLFIDIKTLFFDCDNFMFYLFTDGDSQRDHVLGFFSKEKVSYDDYNLACIVVLPPFQKQGFGMLMIEFSYELSRRAGTVGTPERPLSDLGLRSYLAYWIATLIRFLRRLLSVVPPESAQVISSGQLPNVSDLRSPSRELDDGHRAKKKRTKGKDDDMDSSLAVAPLELMDDPLVTSLRSIETVANPDGSATSHVMVRCTLTDIARATNLRVEDAAFALNECGLLTKRRQEDGEETSEETSEEIVVSREMIERVAKERKVKRGCMVLDFVLL